MHGTKTGLFTFYGFNFEFFSKVLTDINTPLFGLHDEAKGVYETQGY
jgi:hypothetical protein